MADLRVDRGFSSSDLSARARRLWDHAEQIYSAVNIPGVSFQIVKASPSLWAILEHVHEVGRVEVERKYAADLSRLEAERAELEAKLRSLGIDPKPRMSDRGEATSASPRAPGNAPPTPTLTAEQIDQMALLRDLTDAIAAQVMINGMLFSFLDKDIPDPPTSWPECIRQPVAHGTNRTLVGVTQDVILGRLRPPRSESPEAYLARFTRRILRLDEDLWGAVAHAISAGRWTRADNPIAYVSAVAQRAHRRASGWLDPERSRDVFALGTPMSLDLPVTADPLGALIAARSDPLKDVELQVDLELAIRRAGLPANAETALYARLEGISRRAASEILGWPSTEAEAGWKALQRALPDLRKHLSA